MNDGHRNQQPTAGPSSSRKRTIAFAVLAVVVLGASFGLVQLLLRANTASADSPAAAPANPLRSSDGAPPAKQVAAAPVANAPPAAVPGHHPLDAAIERAEQIAKHLREDVKDYTCVIVKQERIDGKLHDEEFMAAKIRPDPLSVYLKFLKPGDLKGREVLYVEGANDGKLAAHEGSGFRSLLPVIWLKPTDPLAMNGQRYPITTIGMSKLTGRLIEVAKHDRQFGEVEVHFYKNAKVNGRVCSVIEVIHPVPRQSFLFHKAVIYIDDELNLPIRYEAYSWPKNPGDKPPLDESYTYLNVKLNVGLTDADFDVKNPKYHFIGK